MRPRKDSGGSFWFVVACSGLGVGVEASSTQAPCNQIGEGAHRSAAPGRAPAGEQRIVSDCGQQDSPQPVARGMVYIVTPSAELRERLRHLLRVADVSVAGFNCVEDCLRALDHNVGGCTVVVGEMPAVADVAIHQRAVPPALSVPVVALTEANNLAAAIEAMKARAFDVVEQPAIETRLLEVVRAALHEQRVRRQQHEACLEVQRRYAELTSREREILHLVAAGLRSRAIAARLGIREKTVEVYRSRVNHKMNARNAAELAQMLRCIEL